MKPSSSTVSPPSPTNSTDSCRFRIVIPARYQSTRLPGKPLLKIAGQPMIYHVYQNAVQAGAENVIVATDDQRIADAVANFGGEAMLTSTEHASGTDRIAEIIERKQWDDDAIIVNLQGDEPAIGPQLLRRVAIALHDTPDAGMSTMATPIRDMPSLFNPNVVKVVTSNRKMALYFSRAPIPWVRDRFRDVASTSGALADRPLPDNTTFLRHLGLYAYRAWALKQLSVEPPCPCELAESLEQLRALALGIQIHVSEIENAPAHGVDTENDLLRINKQMSNE